MLSKFLFSIQFKPITQPILKLNQLTRALKHQDQQITPKQLCHYINQFQTLDAASTNLIIKFLVSHNMDYVDIEGVVRRNKQFVSIDMMISVLQYQLKQGKDGSYFFGQLEDQLQYFCGKNYAELLFAIQNQPKELQIEQKLLERLPEVINDLNLYQLSLLTQGLVKRGHSCGQIWGKIMNRFEIVRKQQRDSYALTYCLWSFAIARQRVSQNLTEDVLRCLEVAKTNEIILMAWSLDKLGIGDKEFWSKVYDSRLIGLQSVNLKEATILTKVLSKVTCVDDAKWKQLEQTMMILLIKEGNDQVVQKSLVTTIQSFGMHHQGSNEFWKLCDKILSKGLSFLPSHSKVRMLHVLLDENSDIKLDMFEKIVKSLNLTELRFSEFVIVLFNCTRFKQISFKWLLLEFDILQFLRKEITDHRDLSQFCWCLGKLQMSLKDKESLLLIQKLEDHLSSFNMFDTTQILQSLQHIKMDGAISFINRLIILKRPLFNDVTLKAAMHFYDKLENEVKQLL